MNILLISRGLPSRRDPQWGCFELDQAKALQAFGHNVIIASVDTRFRLYWRKIGLSTGNINGIRTYNLFVFPGSIIHILGDRAYNCYNKWLWQKMEKILLNENEKIDIIYTHYLRNTYRAMQYMKQINAPIVAIEHWSEINREPMNRNVEIMAQKSYPYVDRLITVSKSLQQRIINKFNIPSVVIHNLIGKEFYYTNSKPLPKFTFISVGSLLPVKNHTLLISALSKLNLPKTDWQLIIIGEGPERTKLQNQINNAYLQNNIILAGIKSKEEIAKLLNESHAFVLPSISENFSVAVLEALACGMPVIASICGGIRECIEDKNGVLFEVNDEEGLAKCLNHMFHYYSDYDRQAIADDCKARFSSEVIAKQLTGIFEEVVAKNKK